MTARRQPSLRGSRAVWLEGSSAGESTAYWERVWSSTDRADLLARHVAEPDATMRLLASAVPDRGVILEAGAGASTYLAALRGPGRTLVGVDLAKGALSDSREQWPDLGYVCGDIRSMPFGDGSVDCLISLGVVEHDRGELLEVLGEHRRVLRSGGVGLVSVPVISGVKWMKDRWNLTLRGRSDYRARGRIVTDALAPPPGHDSQPGFDRASFHQYEFRLGWWNRMLGSAGFEIVAHHRYLVSAGIGEIGPLARRSGRSSPAVESTGGAVDHGSQPAGPVATLRSGLVESVRRAVIAEQPSGVIEGIACAVGQQLLGHMVLSEVRAAK